MKPNVDVNILVYSYVLRVWLVYRLSLAPCCILFRGVWLKLPAVCLPTQDIRAIDTSKATGPVSRVYNVAVRELTDYITVTFCDRVFSFRKNYRVNPPVIHQLWTPTDLHVRYILYVHCCRLIYEYLNVILSPAEADIWKWHKSRGLGTEMIWNSGIDNEPKLNAGLTNNFKNI